MPATKTTATITVVDVTGRTIQTQTIAANNQPTKLSLTNLPTGTHFVKVDAGAEIYREKFVVQ